MIAKWNSQCPNCRGPIAKGDDVAYDPIARKVSHHDCNPDSPSDESAEDIAVRLGYDRHDDSWRLGKRDLLLLPGDDPDGSTGRPESEAPEDGTPVRPV